MWSTNTALARRAWNFGQGLRCLSSMFRTPPLIQEGPGSDPRGQVYRTQQWAVQLGIYKSGERSPVEFQSELASTQQIIEFRVIG